MSKSQTQTTAGFEEWWQAGDRAWQMPENYHVASAAYAAGVASQQAEIERLDRVFVRWHLARGASQRAEIERLNDAITNCEKMFERQRHVTQVQRESLANYEAQLARYEAVVEKVRLFQAVLANHDQDLVDEWWYRPWYIDVDSALSALDSVKQP